MAEDGHATAEKKSLQMDENKEDFQPVSRRKRKKDLVEDMDTTFTAKKPNFPALSGESLSVCVINQTLCNQ